MRTCDRIVITTPYPGGTYRIPLKIPSIWYGRLVERKDPRKTLAMSQIEQLLPQVVRAVFGQSVDHQVVDLALNLDCLVNDEADTTFQKLSNLVTLEVLKYFPRIGGEIPESFYNLIDLDLYIYVPTQYEDQHGYFF